MQYSTLIKKINKMNNDLLNVFPKKTTGRPPSIDGFVFKDLWLHFGLNGSDYDTGNGKPENDSFLQSISHLDDSSPKFIKVSNYLKKNGYIYETYFSKPMKFYYRNDRYPIWQHPDFFKVYPSYLERIEDTNVIKFLLDNKKSLDDRFIVFSDLLFIRDRKSRNIKDSNIFNTFGEQIWDSWVDQIKYYQPKGIIVANAQAQDFIRLKLGKEPYTYLTSFECIPVILSSHFSYGQLSDPLFGLLSDLYANVVERLEGVSKE